MPLQRVSAQDDAPDWCVAVWYPSSEMLGGLDAIRANADVIGIVHPFWYAPLPDGTLETVDEDADVLAEWRGLGVTIIPTIRAGFWQQIVDPAVRALHVEQIVALVERMDYDGIDIDYEGFPLSTRDDFSTFMEMLSDELHARGRLLTTAVHAKTDDAGTWESAAAQDWTRIAPAVDIFTIMTYDYTSSIQPPGPIAPPDWTRAVLRYAATVTDLRKVRMGLHFYGYNWVRDNPPAHNISWVEVERLVQSFGVEIQRDPADMEAHLEFKARGLPKRTIYFADSVGIEYKLQAVLAEFPQLGGVAIWGIGGEDPANWDILRAARQAHCMLTT
ncbi:MAG: hypothetical protein IT319_03420 [Anaerolineae bacterium]|nr:hypothetical protein [Anaerolineae bacterium]